MWWPLRHKCLFYLSVPGAAESIRCNLIPPLSWDPQWAPGWVCGTCLCSSPFPHPLFSLCTHLWMFRCMDLSDMFVCREGNSLLNYSRVTRNFKESDLSCGHASDMTSSSCSYCLLLVFKKSNWILNIDLVFCNLRKFTWYF